MPYIINSNPCKVCKKYGESKPLSEYSYKRPTGRKPGYQPRCKSCGAEDTRSWYNANKERARETRLQKAYGIGINEYNARIENQDNRCLICNTEFNLGKWDGDSPVIDHCHTTGEVRGILCNECNRGLGYFHDNQEALIRASKYLKGEL